MEDKKIIIVSNGKTTHVMVDGKLYGDRIIEVKFSHKKKKHGRDDAELLLTSDAVPIPEGSDEEKQEFMKILEDFSRE